MDHFLAVGPAGAKLQVIEVDATDSTKGNRRVQLVGDVLQEQKKQTDAVGGVVTFAQNITSIEIYNTDATNSGTFTVNGIGITVPATKSFKANIGGTVGKTVTVTGSTSYILSRYT